MFNGFSPEAIDFLWGIRFNNNREWFGAHKNEYLETLYRPMQELAHYVSEHNVLEDATVKTARIYRDVRYSNGVPYKEHLWFCVRKPNVMWRESPSLYFQIEPEGGTCGFIFYSPAAQIMQRHRNKMLSGDDRLSTIMMDILKDKRFTNKSTYYKRPKPGYRESYGDVYNLKNCFIECRVPAGDLLFSPEFKDFLLEVFTAVEPLYRYFAALLAEIE